jgi:hypothetical protein
VRLDRSILFSSILSLKAFAQIRLCLGLVSIDLVSGIERWILHNEWSEPVSSSIVYSVIDGVIGPFEKHRSISVG